MKALKLKASFLGIAVLALSACAITPSERIDANKAAFNGLPPDQQALVRQGQVGIGFSETAVKLTVGEPNRITDRVDEHGHTVQWRYTEYETDEGAPLFTGFYQQFYGPAYGPGFLPYYANYSDRRERDFLKVSFRDGRVTAVEREVK